MKLEAEYRAMKSEMARRSLESEDELGIDGLTIVLHLKNKEDVVINTDLRQSE